MVWASTYLGSQYNDAAFFREAVWCENLSTLILQVFWGIQSWGEGKHKKSSISWCGQNKRKKWDDKEIKGWCSMRCKSHWEVWIKSSCRDLTLICPLATVTTLLTAGPHCARSIAQMHCNFYRHALPWTVSNLSWWARAQRHKERKQLVQSRLVAEIKIGSRSPAANWMHPMEKSVICLPSPWGSFQAEKSVQEKKQGKGESVGLRVLIGIHRNMLTVCNFLPVESSKEINKYRLFKQNPRLSSCSTQSPC